ELDLPREDVAPHHPVSHERVERIREGRRAILLEEEVTDPGEDVAAGKSDEYPQGTTRREGGHEARETERSAEEMQAPAGSVRVLGEVEGIEVPERRVPFSRHH